MPTYFFQTVPSPEARTFDPENHCELRQSRRAADGICSFELVFPAQTVPFAAECTIVRVKDEHPDGVNELVYTVLADPWLMKRPDWDDLQQAIQAALTAFGYSHGRGPNRTVEVRF